MVKKSSQQKLPQVLVIIGPTASGKTSLGVKLAAELNGEIISADSRQVYRGMDIGTGKDLAEYCLAGRQIKHHLLDIVQPNTKFDVAKYQKLAYRAIKGVIDRGHLPIIVGGSGLYLQAVVAGYQLTTVKPDFQKRIAWEQLSVAELLAKIKAKKPAFAQRLNNSERHNQRRLIRYWEIIEAGGELITITKSKSQIPPPIYDFLILGLDWSTEILRDRIAQRLRDRLEGQDLIGEVCRLHQSGVTWCRLISFGLEYKFVSQYLLGKLNEEQLFFQLNTAIYRFAKKQKTWFRRWMRQGQKIIWLEKPTAARSLVKKWLIK